jgi:hypothetical protein
MSVLLSYHQTFINAVRATGGNNSSRTLIVQGPGTDIEKTNSLMNTMPTDQIASRLMVEVHYYTPYQFCLMSADASWGNMFYYWGSGYHSATDASRNATWGEEADVEKYFGMMKTKFVDKGIPVIIGEFGAMKRANIPDMSTHLAARQYFYKYVVNSAVTKGMIPVCWDAGSPYSVNTMGLFDRSTGSVADQGVVNAIMTGAGGGGTTTTYITLKNRATGLLIDGMGRTSYGSNCGQYASSGSTNQQWTEETAGSFVKLKNRGTGLYLDGMGNATNGAAAGQWGSSSSYNQQWAKETAGSYIKYKNRATGLYLDGMGRTSNGSDLGQWSNSSSNNQQWTITSVKSAPSLISTNESEDINIFPNPVKNGLINIELNGATNSADIRIIDLNGKIVQEKTFLDQNLVQMGLNIAPGIYLMQIISGEKNIIKRIVVE